MYGYNAGVPHEIPVPFRVRFMCFPAEQKLHLFGRLQQAWSVSRCFRVEDPRSKELPAVEGQRVGLKKDKKMNVYGGRLEVPDSQFSPVVAVESFYDVFSGTSWLCNWQDKASSRP